MHRSYFYILLYICFLLPSFGGKAQPVPEEKARVAAIAFYQSCPEFSHIASRSPSEVDHSWSLFAGGAPVFHVFSIDPEGFIIISADRSVRPVLAFSPAGICPEDGAPASFTAWMQNYTREILRIRNSNILPDAEATGLWDGLLQAGRRAGEIDGQGVEPLLDSHWHQGYPYNIACPADAAGPGGHAYAGCVATAMAQVVGYFMHPSRGTGNVKYYLSNYDTISVEFGQATYQWSYMVNTIHDRPNPYVSELLFHCGASVLTSYSSNGSGASTENCTGALVNHFGYDTGAAYVSRTNFPDAWTDSIRSNLDRGWPVIYRGGGLGGGHCFVCDGYALEDYFHFNWGWGGSCDGYYYLDALTPGGCDLTWQQGAVINIHPAGKVSHISHDTLVLVENAGRICHGKAFRNYGPGERFGWLISPDSSLYQGIMILFDRMETESGGDMVRIYDGPDSDSPLLGEYSGSELPPVVSSTSARVFIEFSSDDDLEGTGFSLSYYSLEGPFCEGTSELRTPSGWISDGSGPYDYTNHTNASWLIRPEYPDWDSIGRICLHIVSFNTREEDIVTVYDGPDDSCPVLAILSGEVSAGTITGTKDKMLIHFSSDSLGTSKGWLFSYESLLPEYCPDTSYLTSSQGTIGDGSGDKKYNPDTRCTWLIEPENASGFTIMFNEFDTEYGYDRLTIFDATTRSPKVLATITGNYLPAPIYFQAEKIILCFETDATNNRAGWELEYTTDITAIPENDGHGMVIYPNPARDHIYLRYAGEWNDKMPVIQAFDLLGKEMDTRVVRLSDGYLVNCSGWPAGFYVLHIISNGQCWKRRLIKSPG